MPSQPNKAFRKAMAQAKQIRNKGATKPNVKAWASSLRRALEDSPSFPSAKN